MLEDEGEVSDGIKGLLGGGAAVIVLLSIAVAFLVYRRWRRGHRKRLARASAGQPHTKSSEPAHMVRSPR